MRTVVALIAGGALAAMAAAQPAATFSARMKALTDLQRRGAIRGAIVGSGERCPKIAGVAYQQPYRNLDMWTARCNGATPRERPYDYGVFLGPDGDVQVRSCADLVALKLPVCRGVR